MGKYERVNEQDDGWTRKKFFDASNASNMIEGCLTDTSDLGIKTKMGIESHTKISYSWRGKIRVSPTISGIGAGFILE